MSFEVKDFYYKKAKSENYVARSIYKLQEIDKKFAVLSSGDQVLDLGYYPGSWIQYTSQRVGSKGRVIGIDIQEVNAKLATTPHVQLFQRDIFTVNQLSDLGVERPFDVVLSDMAPSTTGVKIVDQLRSLELVEKVFTLLPLFLAEGGHAVFKIFESQDAQDFLKTQRSHFEKLSYFRPKSTRDVSKEFFVIGKCFKL